VCTAFQYGWTALHKACIWKRIGIAESLIMHGADVNLRINDVSSIVIPGNFLMFHICYCVLESEDSIRVVNSASRSRTTAGTISTPDHQAIAIKDELCIAAGSGRFHAYHTEIIIMGA
jgi:hypothetical protein